MNDYSQPLEYHFSELSIHFAKFVSAYLKSKSFSPLSVCDAYAGCGVVGLELRSHFDSQVKVDFIELQKVVFETHLKLNSQWKENSGEFFFMGLKEFNQEFEKSFDLIVANPPYYEASRVRLSPNEVKARAHCFIEGSVDDFFLLTKKSLKRIGFSFFLFPSESSESQLQGLALSYALELCNLGKLNGDIGLFLLRHLNEK